MSLKNLIACGGKEISVEVKRAGTRLKVTVSADNKFIKEYVIDNGHKIDISLK